MVKSVEMRDSFFGAFAILQGVAGAVFLSIVIKWDTPWNVQHCIGMILLCVGAFLVIVARVQLGKSFAIRAKAKALVTHGLYSKIRNPVYLFSTVMFAGVILVIQAPILWVVLAALITFQTIRARREAVVLEDTYGEIYREYRRRTWF